MVEEIERPSLLVIVRHGESARNVALQSSLYLPKEDLDRFEGIPDHKIPLTEEGKRQARETGIAIRKKYGVFDVVYDSQYLRTIQTRDGILEAYTPLQRERMKIRHSHLVREREPGYTFGMSDEDVEQYFPWFKRYWDSFGYFYARPPGGENQAEVCQRVHDFVNNDLVRIRRGKKVLIVTHGGTIRAFRFNLEKWTPEDYMREFEEGEHPTYCGVTAYRHSRDTGRLEEKEYNTVYWK
ncbi:MAG: phosphoglycerate mutase family protein [bacterium]|nr:phosphoglycerate mutase family protein [bacterium]